MKTAMKGAKMLVILNSKRVKLQVTIFKNSYLKFDTSVPKFWQIPLSG